MIVRSARYAVAVAVVLGVGALLAGCGGGGGGASTTSGQDVPQPKQAIADQVPAFEEAASSSDCALALQVTHPVKLPEPEAGDSKKNCAEAVGSLRSVQGFKATTSKEFGTGALVDGQSSGKEQSLVWALDDQGDFKWTGLVADAHELDTNSTERTGFKQPVDAFLEALREEDCQAAHAQLAPGSRLSYGDEKTFCGLFAKNFTADAEGFGSRLQADPEAQATELGGNNDFRFYGVATNPAGYRTVIVGAVGKDAPKIYDVIPARR
jgi:hypothetical protein